jgi:hypothetical protein
MDKDRPESDPPKPTALSPSLEKILNEDRIGLAQEQRKRLRLMTVYISIEFDRGKAPKWRDK